jgi:hypothetical protein
LKSEDLLTLQKISVPWLQTMHLRGWTVKSSVSILCYIIVQCTVVMTSLCGAYVDESLLDRVIDWWH